MRKDQCKMKTGKAEKEEGRETGWERGKGGEGRGGEGRYLGVGKKGERFEVERTKGVLIAIRSDLNKDA